MVQKAEVKKSLWILRKLPVFPQIIWKRSQSPKEFQAEQVGGENEKDITHAQAWEEGPQSGLEAPTTDFTFPVLFKDWVSKTSY